MALVIEDGTIVSGANSYGTTTGLCDYATLRGVTITGAAATVESYLIMAMDFIEGQHARYQGCITDEDQALQFPRVGLYVNGLSVGSNSIPSEVIYAQYALAMESFAGNDLQPTRQPTDPSQFTKQKIGPLELEYSDPSVPRSYTPAFAKAEALLSHLYRQNGLQLIRA